MLRLSRLIVFILILSQGQMVSAKDNFNLIGEVSTSNKSIDFTTTNGDTGEKVNFAADLLTLDYALTASFGSLYARYKISQTLNDDTRQVLDTFVTMERDDQDITIGQFLGGGVSFFIGYKKSDYFGTVSPDLILPGIHFGQKVVWTDEGGFAGLAYSTPAGKGSLSFSVAYADMDGELVIKFVQGNKESTKGKTTGTSISLNWSTPVADATNIVLGINSTRYDMEDKDFGIGTGVDFSTEQKLDSLSLGLMHYF